MSADDVGVGLFLATVFTVLGALAIRMTSHHRDTLPLQQKMLLVSYAVRFAMSLLLYLGGLNKQIVGDGDDNGWYVGAGIKSTWDAEGIGFLEMPAALLGAYDGHHRGYYYLLAVLYTMTGFSSQLSAAALSGFCGALGVIFAYRTARLLFSEWVATRVGWWTCFFPLMIIWSAQSIKEPVIILLEGMALYGCLSIRTHGFSARAIMMAGISIALLPTLRFYAAYVTGAVIVLTLALPQIKRKRMSLGAALVTAMLVLPLLSSTGSLSRHSDTFSEWDVNRISKFRKDIATGSGSGVESNYDMMTSRGLGLATLDGAVHLLLAPFPWEMRIGSLRMILTTPELVFWWILFVRGVIPGLGYAIRRRFNDVLPLLLFLGGLGFIYSVTFGNIGVVYRQRAQLMPYLLMFGALGLEQRRLRRTAVRFVPSKDRLDPLWTRGVDTKAPIAALPVLNLPTLNVVKEGEGDGSGPRRASGATGSKAEFPPGPPTFAPDSAGSKG